MQVGLLRHRRIRTHHLTVHRILTVAIAATRVPVQVTHHPIAVVGAAEGVTDEYCYP
ncbi:hypothetical protein D3C79_1013600 [compost metagenome]